jgi:hypothetical protein
MEQIPSVGRIVHYVWPDPHEGLVCRAAIVTAVDVKQNEELDMQLRSDEPDATGIGWIIDVAVFFPLGSAFYRNVSFDGGTMPGAAAPQPYTWHWPERV